MSKIPILFLIFNRPETTRRVFDAIRAYRPERLFVAADGPRYQLEGETEKCMLAREAALRIDWPCEINTRLLSQNLGCRKAVSSAVDWFFSQADEGAILEDDCLPCPGFFRFAEAMLEHFRDDERVMHISGVNFQNGVKRGNADGFFSAIPHIWGWASWKRAWKHYDADMNDYPELRDSGELAARLPGSRYLKWVLLRMMEQTYRKSPYFNTWDVQWHYALAKRGALAVTPNANLVSNIGGSSTHRVENSLCEMPFGELAENPTPPGPPEAADTAADRRTLKKIYAGGLRSRLRYLAELCFGQKE
jgi:hypothetical protein